MKRNRDILFEALYQPISPDARLPDRMMRERSSQQRN